MCAKHQKELQSLYFVVNFCVFVAMHDNVIHENHSQTSSLCFKCVIGENVPSEMPKTNDSQKYSTAK